MGEFLHIVEMEAREALPLGFFMVVLARDVFAEIESVIIVLLQPDSVQVLTPETVEPNCQRYGFVGV